jgi:hypothetical protein
MEPRTNPFPLSYQLTPDQFCNRELEFKKVIESIKKNKPVLLKGIRRIGKTSLLKKIEHDFKIQKNINVFYIDLYAARNQADFIKHFARQSIGKSDPNNLKLMRDIANYFTYLRPFIEYSAIDGTSTINFNLDQEYSAQLTIEQLFSFLEKLTSPSIIIIDEIQQLSSFNESLTADFLFKNITLSKNIQVIYSASICENSKKLMNKYEKHFLSIEAVDLFCIDHDLYRLHIFNLLKKNKINIAETIVDQILDWCRDHTFYVQFVCNRIFQNGIKQPDEWMIERLFSDILYEHEAVYFSYRNLLTLNQWDLLRAIAKENGARQVLGNEFIRKYNLGSTSSIQTALAALIEKEMVIDAEGRFFVCDVFLSRWLERS